VERHRLTDLRTQQALEALAERQGALVTDGQAEPLAVIRTLEPVLVDVTQSAAEIIAWRRGLMADRLGDVVEERVLEIVEARDGDWIVGDGLAAGDRLIVEGLQQVRPGVEAAPDERAPARDDVARAETE
jgi:hypothetical protein